MASQAKAVLRQPFQMQVNGFKNGIQRFVERIARRETAGQIGNRHTETNSIVGMQHNRETHGNLLFPSRLLTNAVQRTGGDVAVRVLDRHQARFGGMLELVMRAFDARQAPAICFQLLDDLLAVHGGYYNHRRAKGNSTAGYDIANGVSSLCEGLGKSKRVQAETYPRFCYRHIERNPVRAGSFGRLEVTAVGDYGELIGSGRLLGNALRDDNAKISGGRDRITATARNDNDWRYAA